MNKCIFMGNLSRDVELNFTGSGMAVSKFGMAIQRFKKDDGADFINCVAFGKTAETMANYLQKGSKVLVETHVQCGSYENKEGKKVYTTDFVIDRFEFCGGAVAEKPNNPSSYLPDSEFDPDITPVDDGDMPF